MNAKDFSNLTRSLKQAGKIKRGKMKAHQRSNFTPQTFGRFATNSQVTERIRSDDWGKHFDTPKLGTRPAIAPKGLRRHY